MGKCMLRCPNCGDEYKSLGRHFVGCGYPSLSDDIKNTIKAQLIGDGTIDSYNSKNNRLSITNTEKEYLEYCNDQLPYWLSASTCELSVNDNQKDTYRLRTISHPWFNELYNEWYQDNEMKLRVSSLTPELLSHWYASDGNYHKNGPSMRISIGTKFWPEEKEYISSLFNEISLNITSNGDNQFAIAQKDHDLFFDYIHGPIPGYYYKWPNC